jgi:hypothetical protein
MTQPDVMAAFAQVFAPKNPFPRFYQPNPGIGAILVQSQEEEDEYKARDWTPKPLPGSELPPKQLDTQTQIDNAKAELKAQMDMFAAQQAEFHRMIEARVGSGPDGAVLAAGGAGAASGDVAATQVAGGLSDAPEATPSVVVPGKKK